jgi:hypothetical protein
MLALSLFLLLALSPIIVRAGSFAVTAAVWAIVVPLTWAMMAAIAATLAILAVTGHG